MQRYHLKKDRAKQPQPQPKPEVKPDPKRFANCKEANDAGYYDITRDSPYYGKHLDRDGDGIACEKKEKGIRKSTQLECFFMETCYFVRRFS